MKKKMEGNIANNIIELYKAGDWRAIASTYHCHPDRNKVLWVFPSEDNFVFLQKGLEGLGCDGVLSVGCGSGLLEWMMGEATGLPVQGIEVDSAWWGSKYAPPTFIPLLLTTPTLDKDTTNLLRHSDSTALLFCYFNNREAFENYLEHFSGSVIVIIGPGEGKGVHTDPQPFGDVSDKWTLHAWQEVRSSMDFITIYVRSNNVR